LTVNNFIHQEGRRAAAKNWLSLIDGIEHCVAQAIKQIELTDGVKHFSEIPSVDVGTLISKT